MKSTVVSNGGLLRERRHTPIAAFHSPAIPRAGSHSGAMAQRMPSRSGHCGPRTATPEVQQETAAAEQPTPQRNIIVAVDDSKDSQYACTWAIHNLYKAGDVFHIVHCVPDTVAQVVQAVPTGGHAIFTTRTDDAKLKAEVERATEQMSANFSEIFQTAGVPYELDILMESGAQYMNGVGDVICAKAEELQAAAVVVASHNRSALAEFFLGSICNFCVHHCKQPTMVLHNPGKLEAEAPKEGARHIVITVDDSQQSEAACEWACQHLYQAGDTFHILHVVPAMLARPVYAAGMDGVVYYIPPVGSELEDLQQASKREISKRFIHLMEKHDIPFELDVLSEFSHDPTLSVAKTICKTAEDLKAGCVVLSSHSKGPIVEFLLGSVTSYCTHHCQRPVVVLH